LDKVAAVEKLLRNKIVNTNGESLQG
jgi:hypothetical protein